jgi:hypothetical protein
MLAYLKNVVFLAGFLTQKIALSQRASCSDIYSDAYCSSQSFGFFDYVGISIVAIPLLGALYKSQTFRNNVFGYAALVIGLGMIGVIFGTTIGVIAAFIGIAIIYSKGSKVEGEQPNESVSLRNNYQASNKESERKCETFKSEPPLTKNIEFLQTEIATEKHKPPYIPPKAKEKSWYLASDGIYDKWNLNNFIPKKDYWVVKKPEDGYKIKSKLFYFPDSGVVVPSFLKKNEVEIPLLDEDKAVTTCPNCNLKCKITALRSIEINCPKCKACWTQRF